MTSSVQRPGWEPVPLRAEHDLAHGGRWTSLRAGGREWLWHHPDPAVHARRRAARPGDAFVDAGGGEECLPTVGGAPDHGALWPARWAGTPQDAWASAGGWGLRRRVVHVDGAVRVHHTVSGEPGSALLHAVHLLLATSTGARLELPGAEGRPCRVDDEAGARGRRADSWPPRVGDRGADRLGPDDGSATLVLVPGAREALVVDGHHALRLVWSVPHGQPTGVLLWRNLHGWPSGAPYRTTGVEPLLGAASDLSSCAVDHGGDVEDVDDGVRDRPAVLGADGVLTWTLELSAWCRRAARRPSDRPGQEARTSIPPHEGRT